MIVFIQEFKKSIIQYMNLLYNLQSYIYNFSFMIEQIESEDISDEQLNYKEFLQMNKQFKSKKSNKNGSRLPKQIDMEQKEALKLFMFGQFNQAFQKLKAIMTVYPKNPQLYYLVGMMHEELGQKKKAAHYFSLNAQLSPPDFERWKKIGNLYFQTQFYEQAAYCYGRALKSSNLNVQLLKKRGEAYQKCQQYKKAIIMYTRIISLSNDIDTIKQCARLHCKNHQYDKARQILNRVKQNNLNIIYMICETFMKQQKYEDAYKQICSSVLKNYDLESLPIDIMRIYIICQVKMGIGNQQKNIQIIQNLLNEGNVEVFENLVNQLESSGKIDQCLQILEFLCQTYPKPQIYIRLAQLYKRQNLPADAVSVLQQGLQTYPDNKQIKNKLGYLKILEGDEKTGINLIKQQEKQSEIQQVYLSDNSDNENNVDNQKKNKVLNVQNEEIYIPQQPKKKKLSSNKKQIQYTPCAYYLQQQFISTIQNLINLINQKSNAEVLISFYGQVYSLLEKLNQLIKNNKSPDIDYQQKKGLFQRIKSKGKRRQRNQFQTNIQQQKISNVLADWFEKISSIGSWSKISILSTLISRVTFLRKFKTQKQRIYKVCLLACLHLHKFRKCFFFLKYLLNINRQNDSKLLFYALLGNLLVRKINSPSMYGFIYTIFSKRYLKNCKNPYIVFLIAFQYLQSGSFQHAVKTFLKIPITSYNQQVIALSLSSCFIQLASSRNTKDKLSMVNRSVYFLKNYEKSIEQFPQKKRELNFNIGRFFAQLKVNGKAIEYFNKILDSDERDIVFQKATYCLISIYKEMGDEIRCKQLSKKYLLI